MSDEKQARVSSTTYNPSTEWVEVLRHFNETGTFSVQDICTVLGDPVGGIVGTVLPDIETTYRHAIGR